LSGAIGTQLLFEDDIVRVWLLDLAPGEATEWHEHDCDYVFVVTKPGAVRCEYVDGTVEAQDDRLGAVVHRRRDTGHRLVNTGEDRYQNIVVELKGVSDGAG
jgi:hypothetical protein